MTQGIIDKAFHKAKLFNTMYTNRIAINLDEYEKIKQELKAEIEKALQPKYEDHKNGSIGEL